MTTESQAWSYTRHIEAEGQQTALPSSYVQPKSNDAWRHRRILESVLPLLKEFPGARWMTIGDGNYGSDAYFLQQHGADALATSISDSTLRVAKDKGYIRQFGIENAERISADENAFDFTFCKEAYHHFPRPPIAFYEMLRVAKTAVVLLEPSEGRNRLLDHFKSLVKKVIRKDETTLFETSGNFIYRFSVREIEKMMTALNHGFIAYRPINDFYHPKLSGGDYHSFGMRTLLTKLGIAVQNIFCSLRLMNNGLTAMIAFKAAPSESLQARLKQAGYRLVFLPRNPYL